jgi:copper chaperone CopZ
MVITLAVCFIGAATAARAADPGLIVTQQGNAISADSTRVDGSKVHYVPSRSKSEKVIPLGEVAGIIPRLERGKKYDNQKIAMVLELIKTINGKHPSLRRQLNVIESEWVIASKPVDPGIAKEIEAVLQQFKQNPKAESSYKRATTALQMIRFKDKTGSHDAVVDKALVEMKVDYLGFDLPALLAKGDAEKVSKEELKAYRAEAIVALKGKTTEKEKLAVKAAFEKARGTAIRGCIAEVEAFFNKYKAVSVYHKSVEDLEAIKTEICKADSDFELVKASDDKMFGIMKEQYKGYDFSNNKFPLGPKDQS